MLERIGIASTVLFITAGVAVYYIEHKKRTAFKKRIYVD